MYPNLFRDHHNEDDEEGVHGHGGTNKKDIPKEPWEEMAQSLSALILIIAVIIGIMHRDNTTYLIYLAVATVILAFIITAICFKFRDKLE